MFERIKGKNKIETKVNQLSPATSGNEISNLTIRPKVGRGPILDITSFKKVPKNDLKTRVSTRMKSSPVRKKKHSLIDSPKILSVKDMILRMEGVKNGQISKFQAGKVDANPKECLSDENKLNSSKNKSDLNTMVLVNPDAKLLQHGSIKSDDTATIPVNRENPGEIMSRLPNFDVKNAPKSAKSAVSKSKTSFRESWYESKERSSQNHSPKFGEVQLDSALRLESSLDLNLYENCKENSRKDVCPKQNVIYGQRNCQKQETKSVLDKIGTSPCPTEKMKN